MTTVLVSQQAVMPYRVPLFDALAETLETQAITLTVAHGGARVDRPWSRPVRTAVRRTPLGPALWQDLLPLARTADLVVVEHAVRHLVNPLLLAQTRWLPPTAVWGHGADLQPVPGPRGKVLDSVRVLALRAAHWWFAYTDGSARRVVDAGFPVDRISVLQNAADTRALRALAVRRVPDRCVFVGRLHLEKRIPFLLGAADRLAAQRPRFTLAVLGDGPLLPFLRAAQGTRPWLHVAGPMVDARKDVALRSAQLLLVPGLVGLVAVESFAAATPLVTTDIPWHSPEFEYLNSTNAVVMRSGTTPSDYAARVAALLDDDLRLEELRAGCAVSADEIHLEEMVARFSRGLLAALAAPPPRRAPEARR